MTATGRHSEKRMGVKLQCDIPIKKVINLTPAIKDNMFVGAF